MSILAAVDGVESKAVVQRGYELAQAFGEDLVVLHVLPETETREEAEEVAGDAIRLALDDPENVSAAGALGDPAPRILSEADKRDASYVVLGPHKQTPIGKALMGSVSQLVLLNADCTVAFVSEDEE
ncbi:universal stress protein [Haloplanus salinus]|uniref:Universal stress protein n=1 Tax=Haloplanus salinus TaxID=1126245 RepID=A0A368NEW4_9EURY|nr:universal stress protein [Haloplanus salinus]RCU48453.1 universal stress protein [Haloplanus salinus]